MSREISIWPQFNSHERHTARVIATVRVHIGFERRNILQEALSHVHELWFLRIDKAAGFDLFEGLAETLNV